MVVEWATELVDETQEDLKARLRLVAELSRSAMWELRHPIDGGQISRGEALGQVLESHGATFGSTDAVMAEFGANSAILRPLGRRCWKTTRRFCDSTVANWLPEIFLRVERTSREDFVHDASMLLRARKTGRGGEAHALAAAGHG